MSQRFRPYTLLILTLSVFLSLVAGSCEDIAPPTDGDGGAGDNGGGGSAPDTLTRLTFTGGFHPSASPDGSRVVFQTPAGNIAILHLDSGSIDTVFLFGSSPDWGPSPDSILFLLDGIRIASVSGQSSFPLINGSNLQAPEWSPDGKKIVTHGANPAGIYITRLIGSRIDPLPCTTSQGAVCVGEHPSYSGPGDWIVFQEGATISQTPADGGSASVIVENQRPVTEPSYSPNGRFIAFVMQGVNPKTNHIWVSDALGQDSGLWQLTSGPVNDRRPSWGPNSRLIYFDRTDTLGSPPDIWRIGFDSTATPQPAHASPPAPRSKFSRT